jgi:thiamine-phosphate pyrophosphorylase
LEEEEGRAATLLVQAGIALAEVKQALSTQTVKLACSPVVGADGDLAEVFQSAAELAVDLSGERIIASEHLLICLLRSDEGLRRQLEEWGLHWTRLESTVVAGGVAPLRPEEPLELVDLTEQMDTARILDACANRAREALRVVEDYCRFSLDDRFLSGEFKKLRHDLVQTLDLLPSSVLLEARETLRDVGTSLSTQGEEQRYSLVAVVQANLKRLEEALRSLEEYGKLHSSILGRSLEKLRYRGYTLERALLLGSTARQRLADARLYVLVTGSLCKASLDWTIQEAIAGGAQMIQLREKALPDRELLEQARKVRRLTRESGALFIMNDRPDIARLTEADGVHLGQDDLPVKEARRIMGPDALIGISTHAIDQVRQAVLDGASYLGVGPTFVSGTKSFSERPGLDLVRQVAAETSLPAFIIGGMNADTIREAVAAGARRVAVSQAICQAADPRSTAAELRRTLDNE